MRLILFILLAIPLSGQQSSLVPEKSENTNKSGKKIQSDSNGTNTPTALPKASQNSPAPPDTQEKAAEKTEHDRKEPIEVRLLPFDTNVKKDIADYGYIVFSVLLVGVAAYQAILLRGALNETCKATRLTRQSIVLAHRPRLIVRTLYLQPGQTTGGMTPIPAPLSAGSRVDGQFYIVNIGDTTATVTEVYADVFLMGYLPMKRPYEGTTGDQISVVLRPGQSLPYPFVKESPLTADEARRLQEGAQPEARGGAQFLYVIGFVAYTDKLKTPRRTGFARKYDRRSERFEKSDNYDYEHAE